MRFVRRAIIIFFILSIGIFGVSLVVQMQKWDRHAPQITSDRKILEISCDYTNEQLLEGLTATDEEDGDLTSQIIPGSFSKFIGEDLCNVTYVVFDSANQPASLTRQVRFTDYHSPRFTLTEPLVFTTDEGNYGEVKKRLGAIDQLDGNLSDWIIQKDTEVNYQTVGSYTITFEVSNSLGDTVSQALPVHVTGSSSYSLDIILTQGIVYIPKGGSFNANDYINELKNGQGNLLNTSMIHAESNVDVNIPGIYEVHYTADNGAGNTGETWLTVIVEE